ncbi:MAG: T9SS type A sorting domain-containing protein [Saprospiraceae bacterium]
MKYFASIFFLLSLSGSSLAQAVDAGTLSERAAFWWQADSLESGPIINGYPTASAKELNLPNHIVHGSALSVFTVYVPDDQGEEQMLWSLNATDELHTVLTTQRLAQVQRGEFRNFLDTAYVPARLHSYYARLPEEGLILSVLSVPPAQLPVRGFGGSLAEVIVFDAVLSPLERQRVETYLALKYGLTLATDYVDRAGNTVQHILEGEHVWRVAGLGHDPFFSFRQNQSHSIFAPSLLSLRTEGDIAPGSFLVVADDDAPITLVKPGPFQPLTSQRSWQLTATQWSLDNSLVIKIDTSAFPLSYGTDVAKTQHPNYHWWIRQNFEEMPAHYVPLQEGSGAHPIFELRVPKSTGASTFQMVYGPALIPNVEQYAPTCASNSQGELRIAAAALHFPVQYSVFDELNTQIVNGELIDAEDAYFLALEAGEYRLTMEDAVGTRFSESWFFQASDAPTINLESTYYLSEGENLFLDPVLADAGHFEWRNEVGEVLSTAVNFTIHKPGDYELRVSRAGCEARHSFTVARLRESDNIVNVNLWPNPSADGHFQLTANLHQAAAAEVVISDLAGRILFQQELPIHTMRHNFKGRLLKGGMYFIQLKSRESSAVRKLVVE